MVEVTPGLLIGGMGDVLYLLGKHPPRRVTHLLSIVNKPIDWSEINTSQGSLMAKLVSAADIPSTDLLSHFPSCTDFIMEGLTDGTVLVHCEYGISRSSTVVLAYLMKIKNWSLNPALEFLKERKPDVRPNAGFMQQLKLWGLMKYKLDNGHKAYRAYQLHHQAYRMKDAGYIETMNMTSDPAVCPVESSLSFSCRKCRRLLFNDSSILQHDPGTGFSQQHDQYWWVHIMESRVKEVENIDLVERAGEQQTTSQVPSDEESIILDKVKQLRCDIVTMAKGSHDPQVTCTSVFVEPVEWMGPLLLGHKDGKLLCPKCTARIGSFDWAGKQCSCGQWVTPAFQIHKSKVDITHTKLK